MADALVTQPGDQYRQARATQTVNLDVINAVHLLEQCKLTLEATKIARDLARKDLQAEERKYQLGSTTVFVVLDAQTQLAQAELALVQAQNGYQTARSCHRQAPRAPPSETRATSQLRAILREA
jgi:outer membrane protein